MYGIEELKRATGYTDSQVRDRLGLLSPILGEDLHRGKRGKILVGDKILATLRRMAELESQGLSPREAQGRILEELGNGHKDGGSTFAQGRPRSPDVAILRELVEELRGGSSLCALSGRLRNCKDLLFLLLAARGGRDLSHGASQHHNSRAGQSLSRCYWPRDHLPSPALWLHAPSCARVSLRGCLCVDWRCYCVLSVYWWSLALLCHPTRPQTSWDGSLP